MYTLYYPPGASSLAIHAVLRELGQPVHLVERDSTYDFTDLNPVGAVPVLVDGDLVIREGAAILLHLLDKHDNTLLPKSGSPRARALESIMFANATLHAVYGRLFFLQGYVPDPAAREAALADARAWIERLWRVVDRRVGVKPFIDGPQISAADFLLAVFALWHDTLPFPIRIGANSERLVAGVLRHPAFEQARAAEAADGPR